MSESEKTELENVAHALRCARNELSTRLESNPSLPKGATKSMEYALGKIAASLNTLANFVE